MDKETRAAFTQMAQLVVEMAKELVPLVQATQQHPGQLGGLLALPTAATRAASLQSKAAALQQLFGLSQPSQGREEQPL